MDVTRAAECGDHRSGLSLIDALFTEADARHGQGEAADAAALYRAILALSPSHPQACWSLGVLAQGAGQWPEAIDWYRQAVRSDPDHAAASLDLGIALQITGELAESEDWLRRAIALRPDASAYGNLGITLHVLGRREEAVDAYRQAIALKPDDDGAQCCLASLLLDGLRHDEALAACERALSLNPLNALAHYNQACVLKSLNRLDEAVTSFRRAIAIAPEFVEAHFNLAGCLLAQGEFLDGWAEFEWRRRLAGADWFDSWVRGLGSSPWRGEDISDKTILVYAEQGLGDAIQHARFLPLLAARAAKVVVAVHAPLLRLFQTGSNLSLIALGQVPVPAHHVHVPLLSLAGLFAVDAAALSRSGPYLAPLPGDVDHWRDRLEAMSPPGGARLRVGLVWAGNPEQSGDALRSPGLAAVAPLFQVPGVTFVCLQVGGGRRDMADIELPDTVIDLGEAVSDLADSAAILSCLDLMISSCTAPLHLAGALGVPTWGLIPASPHFPWMRTGDETPWYPSLRLFRQDRPGRDWGPVVHQVATRLAERAQGFRRADPVPRPPSLPVVLLLDELIRAAETAKSAGDRAGAAAMYRRWIAHNGDDPLLYQALYNFGSLLSEMGELTAARTALEQAVALAPDFAPAMINLGHACERQGDPHQAIAHWMAVVNRPGGASGSDTGYRAMAWLQIGRVFQGANLLAEAENALWHSLDLEGDQPQAIAHLIALRQRQFSWPVILPWERMPREALLRDVAPLSLAAYSDDPVMQLANAWRHHAINVAPLAPKATVGQWLPPATPRTGPLRVGYLSSDLRAHAVGYLIAEVFERHQRDSVTVFAYFCGPLSDDPIHRRIKTGCDQWVDISGLDDTQAAARIVGDAIDILVDLNGHTKDARTRMLGLRPAPIIVNWLGFPGTMGGANHHYIIADETIIPPSHERYYSETVMRLPCYQPNDRKRTVAANRPQRADFGLPDGAMVYCCFNSAQKVSPQSFGWWMEILGQVPGSVLWLLGPGDAAAVERLYAEAARAGIGRDRLIFAETIAHPEHLARYPLADLFLDTWPYGAHTTASDALWMGVPILTLLGQGFAARVCASLARAAGLSDLICETPDAYVRRAIELGRDAAALAAVKATLAAAQASCVLFDTDLLVTRLEALYGRMWGEYAAGRLPVPDLTNLALYHEIALRLDQGTPDFRSEKANLDRYRSQLAYAHALAPLPADAILWPYTKLR